MNIVEISKAVRFANELTEFSEEMASRPRFELRVEE